MFSTILLRPKTVSITHVQLSCQGWNITWDCIIYSIDVAFKFEFYLTHATIEMNYGGFMLENHREN